MQTDAAQGVSLIQLKTLSGLRVEWSGGEAVEYKRIQNACAPGNFWSAASKFFHEISAFSSGLFLNQKCQVSVKD